MRRNGHRNGCGLLGQKLSQWVSGLVSGIDSTAHRRVIFSADLLAVDWLVESHRTADYLFGVFDKMLVQMPEEAILELRIVEIWRYAGFLSHLNRD
ncbi:hypothetical protein CAL29_28010 [Bordetella genomosp. 10]|uniref:Uncharacterized protein n=1 Tax=Bordetella genomosp. 10 TaxID=1416804 RepID=A0A261S3I9_9BORD|nr:hypothetical protein CAL29_28010 [Bordetella genomosp. 10]